MDQQLQSRLVELIREKHEARPNAQRSRIIREVATEQGLDNLTVANAYLDHLITKTEKKKENRYTIHHVDRLDLWYVYSYGDTPMAVLGPYLTEIDARRKAESL